MCVASLMLIAVFPFKAPTHTDTHTHKIRDATDYLPTYRLCTLDGVGNKSIQAWTTAAAKLLRILNLTPTLSTEGSKGNTRRNAPFKTVNSLNDEF